MIVNMDFVDMGADDIGVIALGEALGQLTAQTVRVLRCDLSGNKGLPQMVGDHIILAAHSAGLLDVLILVKRNSASAILLSHCQLVINLPPSVFCGFSV